jgi:hypothetical protein
MHSPINEDVENEDVENDTLDEGFTRQKRLQQ